MFASVIKNVNGSATGITETLNGVNKRSTVCDADASGKVKVN